VQSLIPVEAASKNVVSLNLRQISNGSCTHFKHPHSYVVYALSLDSSEAKTGFVCSGDASALERLGNLTSSVKWSRVSVNSLILFVRILLGPCKTGDCKTGDRQDDHLRTMNR
jgi:hypothetical protein